MELDLGSMTAHLTNECWTAWVPSEAGRWYHWNTFRVSWGIWHPQPQSRSSDCFIWYHSSTGYTPESQDGHGAVVHIVWPSRRCVAIHSAPGWTLPFYGPGMPLEQVSRHVIVRTNASSTGWGTTMQWTAGPWGSMTWLLGSWGGPEG